MIHSNEKSPVIQRPGQTIDSKLCWTTRVALIYGYISQNRLRVQTQRQGRRQGMICQKHPARHILMAWTCCHLVAVIHSQLQNATNCVHINHQSEEIQWAGLAPSCWYKLRGKYTATHCTSQVWLLKRRRRRRRNTAIFVTLVPLQQCLHWPTAIFPFKQDAICLLMVSKIIKHLALSQSTAQRVCKEFWTKRVAEFWLTLAKTA